MPSSAGSVRRLLRLRKCLPPHKRTSNRRELGGLLRHGRPRASNSISRKGAEGTEASWLRQLEARCGCGADGVLILERAMIGRCTRWRWTPAREQGSDLQSRSFQHQPGKASGALVCSVNFQDKVAQASQPPLCRTQNISLQCRLSDALLPPVSQSPMASCRDRTRRIDGATESNHGMV